MIRTLPIAALALTAPLMVPLLPCTAQAEPVSEVFANTQLEVNVSKLQDGSPMKQSVAKLAHTEVTEALVAELGRRGVPLVDEDAQATIRVSLSWEDYETSHFAIKTEVIRDGQSRILMTDECKLCDEAKVAEVAAAQISGLVRHLVVQRHEPARADLAEEPETEPEPEQSTPDPEEPHPQEEQPSEQPPDPPPAKRLGGAGYAGIASAVLGLGVGVGGLVVAVPGPSERLASDDDGTTELVNRRPLGLALVGAGAGLLAAGAVLIAVDQTVLLRRRERRAGGAALVPTLSPNGAGLAWVGRF